MNPDMRDYPIMYSRPKLQRPTEAIRRKLATGDLFPASKNSSETREIVSKPQHWKKGQKKKNLAEEDSGEQRQVRWNCFHSNRACVTGRQWSKSNWWERGDWNSGWLCFHPPFYITHGEDSGTKNRVMIIASTCNPSEVVHAYRNSWQGRAQALGSAELGGHSYPMFQLGLFIKDSSR